jgi:hypothetical protein
MARKRIYNLLNQAVLTVSDYFMVDKSGNTEAKRVSGQVIVDFIKSNLATVADTGSYNDLSDTPTLATVATSGSYNDLSDTPTIVEKFTDLSDVPASYVGQTGKFVKVNAGENGLEFATVSVTDTNIYNTNGTLTGNRTVTGANYNLTFNSLGDLKFNSKTTGYLFGFFDIGNSIPEFVMDCPSGGQSIFHFRNNGTDSAVYKTIGSALWHQMRELQWRSYTTNYIQMIRDIEGRYLFCNDTTGLDTPDIDTRMKVASDGLAFALKTDAKVRMTNLPTSSAGLSAGDLWNDGGTVKIV